MALQREMWRYLQYGAVLVAVATVAVFVARRTA